MVLSWRGCHEKSTNCGQSMFQKSGEQRGHRKNVETDKDLNAPVVPQDGRQSCFVCPCRLQTQLLQNHWGHSQRLTLVPGSHSTTSLRTPLLKNHFMKKRFTLASDPHSIWKDNHSRLTLTLDSPSIYTGSLWHGLQFSFCRLEESFSEQRIVAKQSHKNKNVVIFFDWHLFSQNFFMCLQGVLFRLFH